MTHERRDYGRLLVEVLEAAYQKAVVNRDEIDGELVEREHALIHDGPADFRAQFSGGGDCIALRTLLHGRWGL